MLNDLRAAVFLAIQAVRKGSRGTLGVVIVIMSLSVINLIFMPSILDNMSDINYKVIVEKQLGHVAIQPEDQHGTLQNIDSLKKKVMSFQEVAGAAEQYRTGAEAVFRDKEVGTEVVFINPDDEKSVTTVYEDLKEGEYISKTSGGEVLVGSDLAGRYNPILFDQSLGGVYAGDRITLRFSNGVNRTYKISGIYKTGDVNTDYRLFLPYSEYEKIYGEKEATHLIIRLNSGSPADFVKKLQSVGIGDDIYDPVERNGYTLAGTFGILKLIMGIIAFMVSGITLFIVVYISAVNKKKLIATMKAIGINTRIIILSFIAQSIFYALMGIIIGLGVVCLVFIPYFRANPLVLPIGYVSLSLNPVNVLVYMAFFTVCSVIAGFIPAYQVSTKNIVETMRS